ncbi:hypothetical protein UZ36_07230 [Candidatus Nitromaritima sp. SCGC AAA799-C22]|nr:hypothetical protein UZ36_07230 [Candidatus Nitromaritima sp. SCGC AAA799-C22]
MKELLGEDLVESTFQDWVKKERPQAIKKLRDSFDSNDSKFSCDYSDLKKIFSVSMVAKILKSEFLPIIESHYNKYNQLTVVDKKLSELKHIFRLTSTDLEIISFLFVMNQSSPFSGAFNGRHHFEDFTEKYPFLSHGWKFLNAPKSKIRQSLKNGNLIKCKLIDLDRSFTIESWVDDFLSGLESDLNKKFFTKLRDESLPLGAHLVDKKERDILGEFLKKKDATNLLFYGEPGTGKTELAKSLANHSYKKLYVINNREEDSEDCKAMKTSLIAACNILDPKTCIILVDEADDLLNTEFSFFFSGEKNNKSWINQLLDQSKHKIIWITNRSTEIEPSTMRRFAFSLKFKRFNFRKKLQVFNYCLKKKGLEGFFKDEEIQGFCRRYSINAGGISSALKNLKIRKNSRKTAITEKLDTLLKNHETAITGMEHKGSRMKDLGNYNLNALNTSERLEDVLAVTERFLDRQSRSDECRRTNLNILLYGMPGSGKTEFVKYLGKKLKKEIVLKRSSDLLSCWVGGTEKLIAEAFDEAEDGQSILFLDEADSFLNPREDAVRSWEKTQVNELLTQMENFNGVLVCATNFLKGLDQAALRRFKFKIEFRPLTAKGNFEMYQTVLQPLIKGKALSLEEESGIKSLNNLTPGDFHVVAEKFSYLESRLTHRDLISSLINEALFKPKSGIIGFRL